MEPGSPFQTNDSWAEAEGPGAPLATTTHTSSTQQLYSASSTLYRETQETTTTPTGTLVRSPCMLSPSFTSLDVLWVLLIDCG